MTECKRSRIIHLLQYTILIFDAETKVTANINTIHKCQTNFISNIQCTAYTSGPMETYMRIDIQQFFNIINRIVEDRVA